MHTDSQGQEVSTMAMTPARLSGGAGGVGVIQGSPTQLASQVGSSLVSGGLHSSHSLKTRPCHAAQVHWAVKLQCDYLDSKPDDRMMSEDETKQAENEENNKKMMSGMMPISQEEVGDISEAPHPIPFPPCREKTARTRVCALRRQLSQK